MGKTLLFIALSGLVAAGATATVNRHHEVTQSSHRSDIDPSAQKFMQKTVFTHRTAGKTAGAKKTRSGDMATATVNVDFDAARYVPGSVFAFDDAGENFAYESFENGSSVPFEVPAGKYNLVVSFYEYDETGNQLATLYVTRTGVDVAEGSVFDIAASEATKKYTFKAVNHEGTPLELDTYRIVENPDSEWGFDTELVSEGNLLSLNINSALFREGFGWTVGGTMAGGAKYEGYPDPLECQVYYTNGEPGWFPYQIYGLQTGPATNEMVMLIPDEEKPELTVNTADDFTRTYAGEFQKTAYALKQPHQVEGLTFPGFNLTLDGLDMNVGSSPLSPSTDQTEVKDILISVPASTPRTRGWKVTVTPKIGDLVVQYESDTTFFPDGGMMVETNMMYNNILGLPTDINVDKFASNQGVLSSGFLTLDFLKGLNAEIPHHPYLPNAEESPYCVYGSTQPVACTLFSGLDGTYLDYYYTDIYGGNIGSYSDACDFQIYYNDEEIINSNEKEELLWRFQDLVNPWFWEDPAPGKYRFDIQTFPGEIDGMESRTILSTGFDQTKPDCVAPGVQILSFVNKERTITNTFAKPADGTLRLVAGDFVLDPETSDGDGAYVNAPDVVVPTIEYSPYGKNQWKELVCVEDNFDLPPCYGHTPYAPAYTATLMHITEEALMGWFDVRISMTDASGNFMTQTVSPAFKIESLAGVASPVADLDVKVSGNSIIAPADAEVYDLQGRRCGATSLDAGMYIVRCGQRSAKVIVR